MQTPSSQASPQQPKGFWAMIGDFPIAKTWVVLMMLMFTLYYWVPELRSASGLQGLIDSFSVNLGQWETLALVCTVYAVGLVGSGLAGAGLAVFFKETTDACAPVGCCVQEPSLDNRGTYESVSTTEDLTPHQTPDPAPTKTNTDIQSTTNSSALLQELPGSAEPSTPPPTQPLPTISLVTMQPSPEMSRRKLVKQDVTPQNSSIGPSVSDQSSETCVDIPDQPPTQTVGLSKTQ